MSENLDGIEIDPRPINDDIDASRPPTSSNLDQDLMPAGDIKETMRSIENINNQLSAIAEKPAKEQEKLAAEKASLQQRLEELEQRKMSILEQNPDVMETSLNDSFPITKTNTITENGLDEDSSMAA